MTIAGIDSVVLPQFGLPTSAIVFIPPHHLTG